jgi:hypothetical protein
MKRWHYPAGLCSLLLIGSGQILKGEGKKGLKMLLFFYFFLPAMVYLSLFLSGAIGLTVLGVAVIAALVLWLYNIFDALTNETNL